MCHRAPPSRRIARSLSASEAKAAPKTKTQGGGEMNNEISRAPKQIHKSAKRASAVLTFFECVQGPGGAAALHQEIEQAELSRARQVERSRRAVGPS